MTAEIAVLNKFGISIAADSAVTVESIADNEIKQKVYNSANKIFTLSKYAPVGIMFYNTVTLGSVPWEVIVKTYRAQLGSKKCSTLSLYCDDFFKYLTTNKHLFPDETIKRIIVGNFLRSLLELDDESNNAKDFKRKLEKKNSDLEKLNDVDDFDADYIKSVCDKYKDEIDGVIGFCLKASYVAGNKRNLVKLLHLLLLKRRRFTGYSGIVFCGFGEDEYFPRLEEYIVDIHLGDKVRHWKNKEIKIGSDVTSEIIPFADTEVIQTLISGVNPIVDRQSAIGAYGFVSTVMEDILDAIAELSDEARKAYLPELRDLTFEGFKNYLKSMAEFRDKKYTRPIKQSIASLPISELGAVSEALLNSSQILKKVNPDIETVGGPVDVATISKGDGFVWVKRKHYFSAELNHSFINRYLNCE